MASRLLRADWHRACRLARPQRSVGGNALALAREGSIGAPLSSASRTNSGGLTVVSPGHYPSSGKQLPGRSCSTLAGNYGGSADALERVSNSTSGRFGSRNSVLAAGSVPGWRGALLCSSHDGHQLEGRRFLSSRKAKPGGQTGTKTNRSITAEKVLLVLETKDGSNEHTLVSRQQALDAAEAAKLDLVQVSGKSDPVVCKLMDFKREEYRQQKLKRAGARRVQKKKEIRLKGMIANHDFERKVNDIKKYLEKGDMVKVVLEASTSLLKRSGNCLNKLQDNFEAEMEKIEGVVMKRSGGGNGYTRREIECTPKAVKAVKAAKPSVAAAPAVTGGKSSSSSSSSSSPGGGNAVNAAGEKEKPKPVPPPPTGVVDEEIVRGILSGTVAPKRRDEAASSARDSNGGFAADDSEESSGENPSSSPSSSSGDEREEAFSDSEGLDANARSDPREAEVEEGAKLLKLGSVVISGEDVEDHEDITEEAAKSDEMEMDWQRHQARRQEDRRRTQKEASERSSDGHARRGDGGGRKKGRAAGGGGGGGGREARAEDLGRGKDYGARRKAHVSGAGRGGRGQGGGPAAWRGSATAGGDSGANFAGRGRGRGSGGGGGGRRGGGRGLAPSPAPPVRTTPYKWRTSIADGNDVTAGAAAPAAAQKRKPRGGGGSQNAVEAGDAGSPSPSWATPRGGGGGGTAASDAGREIRGFRARFGGGATGGSQQPTEPPRSVGSGPADSAAPVEA